MSEGKTTTDHDEIRSWTEERGGVPATVKATAKKGKGGKAAGILRLDFEPRDEALEEISWEDFFEKFDSEKLAFLYQEETADGSTSRFHKFIARPTDAGAKKPATSKRETGEPAKGKKEASSPASSKARKSKPQAKKA